MLELGRRYGLRQRRLHGDDHAEGLATLEAAMFALLGLMVAFTFSGAATRFDTRRNQIVEEANDIGTAYLRIDLLPADQQPAVRQKFREYTDARIAVYRAMPDLERVRENLARAGALQQDIWGLAVPAAKTEGPYASMLLLPALNAMFDVTTVRTWAAQMHPPLIVFLLLATLAIGCALIAGHGLAAAPERNWLHMIAFSLLLAAAIFVIVDLEYPRVGFLKIDTFDEAIVNVRNGMK
jgi:hypothetical protein